MGCVKSALVYRPESVAPYYAAVEAYPRLRDFRELRRILDPARRFGNVYLDRLVG